MFKRSFSFIFAKSDGMYFPYQWYFPVLLLLPDKQHRVLQSKVQDRFHQFLMNDFYPHDKIVQRYDLSQLLEFQLHYLKRRF